MSKTNINIGPMVIFDILRIWWTQMDPVCVVFWHFATDHVQDLATIGQNGHASWAKWWCWGEGRMLVLIGLGGNVLQTRPIERTDTLIGLLACPEPVWVVVWWRTFFLRYLREDPVDLLVHQLILQVGTGLIFFFEIYARTIGKKKSSRSCRYVMSCRSAQL